jgi:VanZ family protein
MKNRVNLALILVWMTFIFYMSHQTGSESSALSGRVVHLFEFLKIDITSAMGKVLHYIIRKGAHLFEYFILTLLAYNYLKEFVVGKMVWLLPVLIGFIYACTDEFHQIFVPNRAGSFTDVLIDTTGGLIAMFLVAVYHKMIGKVEETES